MAMASLLDDELASLASEIDSVLGEEEEEEFDLSSSSRRHPAMGAGQLPSGRDLTGADAAAFIDAALSDDDADGLEVEMVEEDDGDDEDVRYLLDDTTDDGGEMMAEVAAALAAEEEAAAAAAEEEGGDQGGSADRMGEGTATPTAGTGEELRPPLLLSQAAEEALAPPPHDEGGAAPSQSQSQSQTYTSLTDVDPSHFRRPWDVPSRQFSAAQLLSPTGEDGDADVDGGDGGEEEAGSVAASHRSIELEDELGSLADEMEEVLEEELAAEERERARVAAQERERYRDSDLGGGRGQRNAFEDEGRLMGASPELDDGGQRCEVHVTGGEIDARGDG